MPVCSYTGQFSSYVRWVSWVLHDQVHDDVFGLFTLLVLQPYLGPDLGKYRIAHLCSEPCLVSIDLRIGIKGTLLRSRTLLWVLVRRSWSTSSPADLYKINVSYNMIPSIYTICGTNDWRRIRMIRKLAIFQVLSQYKETKFQVLTGSILKMVEKVTHSMTDIRPPIIANSIFVMVVHLKINLWGKQDSFIIAVTKHDGFTGNEWAHKYLFKSTLLINTSVYVFALRKYIPCEIHIFWHKWILICILI